MTRRLPLALFAALSLTCLLGMPCMAPASDDDDGEQLDAGSVDTFTLPPCEDPAQLRQDALDNGTQILNGITLTSSVSIGDIAADPTSHDGQLVQIEGFVTAVCQSAGCWANLHDASGYELWLKVTDGTLDFRNVVQPDQYVVGEGVFMVNGEHGAQVLIDGHGAMAGTILCP
ncbi:MAG: hypothetical protein ABIJ09_00270 [Pseudomonadota bacterium]